MSSTDPIHVTVEKWHRHTRGDLPGGLDELLHDDVVFLSPVVFTPQVGKDMTKLYLNAAGGVFDSESDSGASDDAGIENLEKSAFRYTKEIASGHHAMLEFESQIEGKYVNGVDILSCDDDGKIIEFKVMIRPLQAVNAIHQQMMQMLERMKQ